MLCRPCLRPRATVRLPKSTALHIRSYVAGFHQDPVISPSSQEHHDLKSFLDYAKRTGLSETSTVYQGTLYEYTVQTALRRLHFTLTRTGQKGDDGVDLIGTWKVPSYRYPLRVFVQCKASMRPVGPQHVRELDGTFAYLPTGWRSSGVIGLLASRKRASRTVKLSLQRSDSPMGCISVRVDGTIREFIWNQAAKLQGLEDLHISQRFLKGREGGRVHRDIALYWRNIVMPYAKDEDGQVTGLLDQAQKDELIESARRIADFVRDKVRVRKTIAKIDEKKAQQPKDIDTQKREKFSYNRPIKPEHESRIGGLSSYIPPATLTRKRRGRPYKIQVDDYGFPTE